MARLARWYSQAKALILFRRRIAVFGSFTVIEAGKISIGRDCAINHGVFLNGRSGIRIGDNVILSARCMLVAAMLEPRAFSVVEGRHYIDAPILIDDGCWIGAGAIVLGGVSLGPNCVVGAGAVVTQDFPADTIIAGNPARAIGKSSVPAENTLS